MTVTVGVIGYGVGRLHAAHAADCPHANLVFICDIDPAARARAGAEHPHTPILSDPVAALAREPQCLVIATYDASHGPLVAEALRRRIAVFVEKPLTTDERSLARIAALLAADRGLRLTTNTLLRRSPRFQWLHSQIEAGALGRVYHIHGGYSYGRLGKLALGWRGADPAYSVTLGGAIHVLDLILWLVGERPTRVQAVGSGLGLRASTWGETTRFKGDSLRAALLEYPSGLTATITADFAAVTPHAHPLTIHGTEATFHQAPMATTPGAVDVPAVLMRGRDTECTAQPVTVPYPAVAKATLLGEFLDSLRGSHEAAITEQEAVITEHKAVISEQEAVDVTAIALAIDSAVRRGAPVGVYYVPVGERAYRMERPQGGGG